MSTLVYVRVSTDEQAEKRYNLSTQTKKITDRCEREGLSVTKTFTDADSARTSDRPQFQEMLSYCRKHRGKITHVVFADLSRLARNVGDQSQILATFKQLGITPISCDERIEDTAAGKLCTNLLGVVNQFFSDSLSERTKYRMAAGVQAGRWLWVAPIGYLNSKNEESSDLLIDSDRADLVHKVFELVASRNYNLKEVLRRVTLLGLTTRSGRNLTKQTLSRMLRNQLYAGWVCSGQHKIRGVHQPIVDQALFDLVQDVLSGNVSAPHTKASEFPLRGFVRCAGCGSKLTAGLVKGRNEKYPRYWCWNAKCKNRVSANQEQVEASFLRLLGMMQPIPEMLNLLPEIAKKYWATRLDRIRVERGQLSKRLSDNRTLNQKILLQKVNGELSPEDFQTLKENVVQQKAEIETKLNELDTENSNMGALLEETQHKVVDLVRSWKEGDARHRNELATNLFPQGLHFSRETLYFAPQNTWVINSLNSMFDSEESLASPTGFEPVLPP